MMIAENKIMTDAIKQAPPQKSPPGSGSKVAPSACAPLEKHLERIEDITVQLHDLIRSPFLVRADHGSREYLKMSEISAAVDALKAELKAVRESGQRSGLPSPPPAKPAALVKPLPAPASASEDKKIVPLTKKISRANIGNPAAAKPLPLAKSLQAPAPPAPAPVATKKQSEKPKPKSETPKTVAAAPAPEAPKKQPEKPKPASEIKIPTPSESQKPKSEIHQKVVDALAQINRIVNKQHNQY